MDGPIDQLTDWWMVVLMVCWMDEGWIDGYIGRRRDWWIDGSTDGLMDNMMDQWMGQ